MRNACIRGLRWTATGIAALALLLVVVNLGLTTAFLAREHELGRWYVDIRRLALSGDHRRGAPAAGAYRQLYAELIGERPDAKDIRSYFEAQADRGGPIVLDQVLTDYILARWGQVDGRTLPPGVYIGARPLGPDAPPLSWVTQYLAQYALFTRHGYVLVVPPPDTASAPVEFSASRAKDFEPDPPDPRQLMIKAEPFQPGAYDFPSRGQAIHELFRLSDGPQVARRSGPELGGLAGALRKTGARYELFRQNSNTVLGCMLRASDLHRDQFERFRSDPLLRLRLLAIGRPLWSEPLQRPADTRCA